MPDWDCRYPGFRFRMVIEQGEIREHIKTFVNQRQERVLAATVGATDAVHIICTLSGGEGAPGDPGLRER